MEKTLVSIITPTYNHEKFIEKCIESVLEQTYPNWEMIIVDDGSTDETGTIISKYNDDRINYIKQKNIGIWNLNKTYNKALNICKGELVAILEGDDFWPMDKLEKQIKCFKDPQVVLSWGKSATINDTIGGYYPASFDRFKELPNNLIIKNLFFGNFIPACTVICRRMDLLEIGGFNQPNGVPYVDYPTWLLLSLRGKFLCLDEILGYWRYHENQTSKVMLFEMFNSMKFSIKFYNTLSKEDKKKININLKDLFKYDLNQIRFNLKGTKSEKIDTNSSAKNPDKNVKLSSKVLIIMLRIYYAFVMNMKWIILISKRN